MRQGTLAATAALLILFASQTVGQQIHRIGFLGAAVVPRPEQAFVEVLKTRGYVVGENLEIDFRHSEGQNERIPALVAELVGELNYNGYCNPEVDELIDRQSGEADRERRKKLVWEIERRLAEDGARPIIFY